MAEMGIWSVIFTRCLGHNQSQTCIAAVLLCGKLRVEANSGGGEVGQGRTLPGLDERGQGGEQRPGVPAGKGRQLYQALMNKAREGEQRPGVPARKGRQLEVPA